MDDREKDEEKNHSQTNSAEDVGHEVSEEALQEREHRSILYTTPVSGVSKGTDTKDDPLPPRKRKKIPPAVPAKKHAAETDSQTEATSAESTASAPRSQPSLIRSASSEFPSSSYSSTREDKTPRTRSLDREGYSSEDEAPRVVESRPRKFTTRHIDYDTAEVLREGKRDNKEPESESHQEESTSFHWRPSASSINIQAVEGCVAGVCRECLLLFLQSFLTKCNLPSPSPGNGLRGDRLGHGSPHHDILVYHLPNGFHSKGGNLGGHIHRGVHANLRATQEKPSSGNRANRRFSGLNS